MVLGAEIPQEHPFVEKHLFGTFPKANTLLLCNGLVPDSEGRYSTAPHINGAARTGGQLRGSYDANYPPPPPQRGLRPTVSCQRCRPNGPQAPEPHVFIYSMCSEFLADFKYALLGSSNAGGYLVHSFFPYWLLRFVDPSLESVPSSHSPSPESRPYLQQVQQVLGPSLPFLTTFGEKACASVV